MSQNDLGTLVSSQTSGAQLAALLRNWRDAIHTMHSGATRPAYVKPGMLWLKSDAKPWVATLWTGTIDVPVFTVHPDTGAIGSDSRYLRIDTQQSLIAAQQFQARFNIDAASRKQVVAAFQGNGSTLFYLTPEMIIDNPVLDYVVSSGSVVISARVGTASGYIGGASDYLINTFQVLGNNNTASFQQARSTLALGSDVMSGTLAVSPIGLRSRASGVVNSSGNRLDVIGTSTITNGDRMVIMNSDGSPLPNGAGIIFYGSKRT